MSSKQTRFDAIIVGAGFAGLYMLHRLQKMGFSVRLFEAGSGIGGTWFWNRYPGARCDVNSMEYSYQFSEELQQKWVWTERYASQPEILSYLEHVANSFDLKKDIQLNTKVTKMIFDEPTNQWQIETDRNEQVSAQFCIMATGCLSATNTPKFKGAEKFKGVVLNTSRWPEQGVDLKGKRVAIVGTGSTSVQAIPHLARDAKHLYVFQRTATYVVPARNGPLDQADQDKIKSEYRAFRERNNQTAFGLSVVLNPKSAIEVSDETRRQEYEARWQEGGLGFSGAFSDLLLNGEANKTAADFVREKIRATVHDPAIAEMLCPDHTILCKRLCIDTGYFETFNRPNVTLVDIKNSPIQEVTENSVVVAGKHYDVDCLIYATGFDAMTGALLRIDIRGRDGLPLSTKWSEGPKNYLGLGISGFPNFFTVTGPGSPSVLSNMIPSIEQHVNWISDCLAHMQAKGARRIEPTEVAEHEWVNHVNTVASYTLLPNCNSWYLGVNIPGKPKVFMPYLGFATYVQTCKEIVANGYEGFHLTSAD